MQLDRYHNSPHHPEIKTFPHHKHVVTSLSIEDRRGIHTQFSDMIGVAQCAHSELSSGFVEHVDGGARVARERRECRPVCAATLFSVPDGKGVVPNETPQC